MKIELENYIFDSGKMIIYDKKYMGYEFQVEDVELNIYDKELNLLKDGIPPKSVRDRFIETAGIALTYNCELRCTYCSQSSVEGIEERLTREDVRVFVSEIIKRKKMESLVNKKKPNMLFYFTGGGEPTYNWEKFTEAIDEVEDCCKRENVEVTLEMTTNGMLNEDQIVFIASHFKKVFISYDGISKIQDKNRRMPNGEKTSEAVENTITKLITLGIEVSIRTTVWQQDLDLMDKMCDNIHDNFKGLYSWEVNPVTSAGRAAKVFKNNKSNFEEYDFVDYYIKLLERNESFFIRTPLLSNTRTGFNCGGVGCIATGLWLLPDGKMTTCIDSSFETTMVGEVKEGRIEFYETYEDPLLEMGIKKYQECRECVAFPVCGSGCPLKHIREKKYQTGVMDWECSMQKKFWIMILKKVIENGEYLGWRKERSIEIEGRNYFKLVEI